MKQMIHSNSYSSIHLLSCIAVTYPCLTSIAKMNGVAEKHRQYLTARHDSVQNVQLLPKPILFCSPIWYNQIPHSSKYDLRNSNIPIFCGRVRIFQYSDVFSRFSRSNMLMFFQKIRHFIHCNYLNLSERKQTFI
jgi:hypothetical protein